MKILRELQLGPGYKAQEYPAGKAPSFTSSATMLQLGPGYKAQEYRIILDRSAMPNILLQLGPGYKAQEYDLAERRNLDAGSRFN